MHTLQVHQMGDLARSRLVTVTSQTPLLIAAQAMCDTQIGLVVVCDSTGAMAGVISKTDIIRQISHCMGGAWPHLDPRVDDAGSGDLPTP